MNEKIIIAVAFIGGTGVVRALLNKAPITGVIIGSFVFLIVLSIADMFGGALSDISGAIAMIAVVYVLLTDFPWKELIGIVRGSKEI